MKQSDIDKIFEFSRSQAEYWVEPVFHTIEEPKRRESIMSNLRSKVRGVLRSKDEQALIDAGFTYESGAVTKEGRKVLADLQLQRDKELRSELVSIAKKLNSQ